MHVESWDAVLQLSNVLAVVIAATQRALQINVIPRAQGTKESQQSFVDTS